MRRSPCVMAEKFLRTTLTSLTTLRVFTCGGDAAMKPVVEEPASQFPEVVRPDVSVLVDEEDTVLEAAIPHWQVVDQELLSRR